MTDMGLLKSVITWQDVNNSDIILIMYALGISAITVVFPDYSFLFIKINAYIMLVNNEVLRKIKIVVKNDVKNWAYISLR